MFKFDSRITLGSSIPNLKENEDLIKHEPMLFSCGFKHSLSLGGPLTKLFLGYLTEDWTSDPSFIVDSRVHMLMPGWYPAIPGFHHDDVPRERSDGQPNYLTPSYKAEHVMMLINGYCCPTEFAIGQAEFEDVPLGQTYYREWHPKVVSFIEDGTLKSIKAPSNTLIYFDSFSWHQGTAAISNGWRFFIRATKNTRRKHFNELRRQVQVYLENPMEGW